MISSNIRPKYGSPSTRYRMSQVPAQVGIKNYLLADNGQGHLASARLAGRNLLTPCAWLGGAPFASSFGSVSMRGVYILNYVCLVSYGSLRESCVPCVCRCANSIFDQICNKKGHLKVATCHRLHANWSSLTSFVVPIESTLSGGTGQPLKLFCP